MTTEIIPQHKITVVAPLFSEKASLAPVVEALSLPPLEQRQPDLQYFTGIFVSSGMNKNGAVFLGSELYKARGSILHKAVDIEHEERTVVGQMASHCFMNYDYSPVDPGKMSEMATADLDAAEMEVAISAILHKARFPEICEQVMRGELMLSMEAYYRDYDVKVGDLIIPRAQASKLGYDKMIGSVVRVKDGNKDLGFHLVGRVLRDIVFCGVGLVKNPANERSIILEAAALKEFVESNKEQAKELNLAEMGSVEVTDGKDNPLLREIVDLLKSALKREDSMYVPANSRPGTCVHYKRYLVAHPDDELIDPQTDLSQYPLYTNAPGDTYLPGTRVIGEHGCSLFDIECSARPGDATMPACWRNVFARTVRDEVNFSYEQIVRDIREKNPQLVKLQQLIDDARKFKQ